MLIRNSFNTKWVFMGLWFAYDLRFLLNVLLVKAVLGADFRIWKAGEPVFHIWGGGGVISGGHD